jgi:D-glycero-alpha-D-manno-heptose 1-phosphate guanylyltransferase
MRLLILAGGFGTRLKPVVSDVPKALARVGELPFLHLQIENWLSQGVKSFVFLLHHQSDLIIKFLKKEKNKLLKGYDVEWVVEPFPMDTGGAVAFAVKELNISQSFLLTNADTWLGSGMKEAWQTVPSGMVVVRVPNSGRYGSVEFNQSNIITTFHEKKNSTDVGWINSGLSHLDAGLFKGWNHEPFSLETLHFTGLALRGALKAIPLDSSFIDIGIPEDYFRFCSWVKSGRKGTL